MIKIQRALIALAASILTSVPALSAEECEVKGYAAVFLANGSLFRNIGVSDGKFLTRTQSWEDCYKYALRKSKEFPSVIELVVRGPAVKSGSAETPGYIFFRWRFDDGIVSDSSGEVTSWTDHFEKSPAKGNLKYLENGEIFR